jgi:hypothetical protein
VTILDGVTALLTRHAIGHALIGAAAMAVHGVSRSTLDQDLLVLDRRALDDDLWQPLTATAHVDIRRGDIDDPLAGVVRVSREGDRIVDVVVGRHEWQQDILTRAIPIGDSPLLVVQRADLILLKLYAGGSQDRWDIEQLLATDASTSTKSAVDERVHALPGRSRELWTALSPR